MEEFDLIVIGAGSGLEVANAYAQRGNEVAVVEPGPLGGTCLNRGCIPSKILIHRADIIEEINGSEEFHIDAEVNDIEFSEIIEEVNKEVAEDAEGIERGIENSDNHALYRTKAKFVDEKVLEVDGEEITADKIVIAAGSRPLIPPIDGAEAVDYLTSKEALELEEQPDDMVIVGGGYIALELAHFYDAVGTEVTIIEMAEQLLSRSDRDVSEKITEIASERFDVHLGYAASELGERDDGRIEVTAENEEGNEKSFEADEVLIAAGRVPNTDELQVEETGIETTERGFVKTNEYLETNIDGLYALGDIADNWMFKHSANLEAEYVYKNLVTGNNYKLEQEVMPSAVFSSPQIAAVGKTEQELEESDTDYVSATYPYSDTGMGMALKEEDGFVKVLASEDGEILGCHILGPDASTLIHQVIVAMTSGSGTVDDIKDTVHIHPALNEVVERAFQKL